MTLPATNFPGLDPLLQSGVIAVVRLTEAVPLGPAARALAAGGVGAVEVTLTTPGAIDAIADLASDQKLAGCVIGAGTVLDESAARYVIDAGARFVVSPALDLSVIRACRDRAVPCMPGAFTPTELLEAWRAAPAAQPARGRTTVRVERPRDVLRRGRGERRGRPEPFRRALRLRHARTRQSRRACGRRSARARRSRHRMDPAGW